MSKLFEIGRTMQFVFAILLIHASNIQVNAKKPNINSVFEGRLARARNTAIASSIANEVNNKLKNKAKKEAIVGDEIFVSPQEVT